MCDRGRQFGTSAELSGHFGSSLMVPKCLGSEVSWVRSVLTPYLLYYCKTRGSAITERPRCRVRYGLRQKQKTGTGRQHFTDIIGLFSTTGVRRKLHRTNRPEILSIHGQKATKRIFKSHLLTHTSTSIKILRQASQVLSWSPAYSTKKTQNAIMPRPDYRSVGRLAKRMSKFATANCPYQTQPRTSVQLTVRAVLQLRTTSLPLGQIDSCRYWLIGRLTVNRHGISFSTLQYSLWSFSFSLC